MSIQVSHDAWDTCIFLIACEWAVDGNAPFWPVAFARPSPLHSSCCSSGHALFGQTSLYWETNKRLPGAGDATTLSQKWSGNFWNTTADGTTTAPAKWTSGSFAIFSAGTDATGAFTVAVSSTQTVAGITIAAGSPVFSGGTISLEGAAPAITVAAGSIATFNSRIASTTLNSGLNMTGDGTMILGNTTNSYTGPTTISSGVLQLGANNSVPVGSAVTVAASATFDVNSKTVAAGSLAGAGNVTLGTGNLTAGADNTSTTFSGIMSGTSTSQFTKSGNGTFTLSGANTFTGIVLVTTGTVLAGAQDVFNSANQITVNSGSILNLADFSQTIGRIDNNGTLALGAGTSNTLTLTSGASTLGGTLTGAGTIIIGSGASLTLGANFNAPNVNIVLNGGTLFLNGTSDTFGTVTFQSSSLLDFGASTASVLSASNVVVYSGAAVTVNNWITTQDYFYAHGSLQGFNPGTGSFTNAVPGQQGVGPQNQIGFNGFASANTQWSSDHQITPFPEPTTYGLIFTGAALAVFLWRRRTASVRPIT